MNLRGTGVAVITPFSGDGTVDYTGLGNIIDHLVEGGIEYIVSLGTTGESVTLNSDEKKKVVAFTLEKANGRVPVVVGAGGNNTAAVAAEMQAYDEVEGIGAYLSASPYYNKPSQEGLYAHYAYLAESTSRGIIMYNVPGRTSKNLDASTALKLANNFSNIIAIKEAANNMVQSQFLAKYKPDGFYVVSGDDDLAMAQMACGFDGVISVVGNAYPKDWSDMIRAGLKGDFQTARTLNQKYLEFIGLIFEENNPGGIKCALSHMGFCDNNFRLPVVPVNSDLNRRLAEVVSNLNVNST